MNYTQLLSWLNPDYQGFLNSGPNEIIEMPITYTRQNLTELFRTTEKDIFSRPVAQKCEVNESRIEVEVANALLGKASGKQAGLVVDHPLLLAFATMGQAMTKGRFVEFAAVGTQENGVSQNFFAKLEPAAMQNFLNQPIQGAQMFFGNVDRQLQRPAMTTFVAYISHFPLEPAPKFG